MPLLRLQNCPWHAFGVDDDGFSLSLQVLFQMLLSMVGHFNQAIMGHSWRAPKLTAVCC